MARCAHDRRRWERWIVCGVSGTFIFCQARGTASEHGSVVLLEAREGRIEQFGPWDDDDVDGLRFGELLAMPEDFSNQALSTIPPDRIAQLSRGDDPEPWAF
jgi:hypothetical protein